MIGVWAHVLIDGFLSFLLINFLAAPSADQADVEGMFLFTSARNQLLSCF
jgi:hypothetical protein